MDIKSLGLVKTNPKLPHISPGDSVKVSFKVKEANRERLQVFPGLVIRVRKGSNGGNFTIRRVASGVGVEHTFPFASPLLDKIEVMRHGKVRRAKLYYMRELSTKEARLKERREKLVEKAMGIVETEVLEEEIITEEVKQAEDVITEEVAEVEVAEEESTGEEVKQEEDIVTEEVAKVEPVEDEVASEKVEEETKKD